MSQHDMSIANQGFPAFRSDLNDALQALVSQNSGATAPSTTFANMIWYDTANNILKMRNEDNDAWISIFTLNQTTDAITAVGSVTLADLLDTADIGTSVQAYDSNLTSFVSTFTLPTSDGTANQALVTNGSGTIGFASVTANEVGFRNRIINGAMMIDQRNAGASVTITGSAPYSLDRWQGYSSTGSKFTVQRNAGSVTPPVGFTNYAGCTSNSAYSITSTDQMLFQQGIEGFNCADLAWGTANAKTITLSFQVYSSLTGTFGGSIQNAAQNRCYPFSFTISSANTWETKSITIAGDTTGTWLTNNEVGIRLIFSLGTGATYSATAGSWTGTSYISSATGATSVVGTNGATFYITGVQLEKGSTATSFDVRPYGTELALCQRYYFGNFYGQGGVCYAASDLPMSVSMPVSMRTAPTFSLKSGSNVTTDIYGGGGSASATIGFTDQWSNLAGRVVISQTSGGALGKFFTVISDNMQVSAEL